MGLVGGEGGTNLRKHLGTAPAGGSVRTGSRGRDDAMDGC